MTRRRYPRETGFQFEAGTVRLISGEIFRPARHAVQRWVVEQPAGFAAVGTHYHCVYQTGDDRFIYVHALISPPQWGSTEEVEEARLMPTDEVRALLLEYSLALPDCLAEGLDSFPEVSPSDPDPEPGEDDTEDNDAAPPSEGGDLPKGVTITNWHEGGQAFAEAFKSVNQDDDAQGQDGDASADADDTDDESQTPALTRSDRFTLRALAAFDPSYLASSSDIAEAMPPAERISERTIRESIRKLVKLDLAERPEGEKQGTRLTLRGRRLAAKIDGDHQ